MLRPIHFELPSDNPEATQKFYTEVFGWSFHKWEGGMPYWLVGTGDKAAPGIDGGVMHAREGFPTNTPVITMDVPDIHEYSDKVTRNGGTLLTEVLPIEGVGLLTYFRDPQGAVFGMIQPTPPAAPAE